MMASSSTSNSGRLVYVIDDDEQRCASTVLLLRSHQITARAFSAGEDFLDEVACLEPGCILLDIRMPGLSGVALLKILKQREVQWPVIVITGHGEISLAVQTTKLGALDFLQKPFLEKELFAVLDTAFELLFNMSS